MGADGVHEAGVSGLGSRGCGAGINIKSLRAKSTEVTTLIRWYAAHGARFRRIYSPDDGRVGEGTGRAGWRRACLMPLRNDTYATAQRSVPQVGAAFSRGLRRVSLSSQLRAVIFAVYADPQHENSVLESYTCTLRTLPA